MDFKYRNAGRAALTGLALLLAAGCGQDTGRGQDTGQRQQSQNTEQATTEAKPLLAFEKFQLDNGLTVIFHVDRSDPVVGVALTAHVGSSREKTGRTGFAHLFEHLLFLESENLGKGGLDAMSARIGGAGANGSTSRDWTNYFQTVPKDALEKMIWAEADKLGWFINTVTDPVLAKEKQVVKNEKRQSIDNRPYGHTRYVTGKALYPEGHPYNWQVIGSLEDLENATLDDVKEFYRTWYTPNNAVLSVAGDFDPAEARAWVEKYFGEIPRGLEVAPQAKQPATLDASKFLFHEDNFARLPNLTLTWPAVPAFDKDGYALDALFALLSEGKTAPLNRVIVDDRKLASGAYAWHYGSELAGSASVSVRAFAGTDLDEVKAAIEEAFRLFEAEGVDEKHLARIMAKAEVGFLAGLGNVTRKAISLAQYEIYTGDPGYGDRELAALKSVTADDIRRVYAAYIKDKPFVATSFVPKGQPSLAVDGSVRAEVVEETIVQGAEKTFDASLNANYEPTPSSFDRSKEPPYGPEPKLPSPKIWETSLANGLRVFGIRDTELPIAEFHLVIDGGHMLDDDGKYGTANLLAEMLDKGTDRLSRAAFEEALDSLGASVSVTASDERIVISGTTLSRTFTPVISLVSEMLLSPRWDDEEFALAKTRTLDAIRAASDNPVSIASNKMKELLYGAGHVFAVPVQGTQNSVNAITLEDLKAYHARNFSPTVASFRIAGSVAEEDVKSALKGLEADWKAADVALPAVTAPPLPTNSAVYFYDVPGAKQSVITFGHPAVTATDENYFPARTMNYILGGGGFASRLTQQLREGKGYTYGIQSGFYSTARQGTFQVFSRIRSNVTLEASMLVRDILRDYGPTFTDADLDVTKNYMIKSRARSFETLGAKLRLLDNVASYGLPHDYVVTRNRLVKALTKDDVKRLALDHINPDRMIYLVVGDAASQADRLEKLGFGPVQMIR